jgi:hypothetical protein
MHYNKIKTGVVKMEAKVELGKNGRRLRKYTGTVRVTVSFPKEIFSMVKRSAEIEKMSRSVFVAKMVLRGYSQYLNEELGPFFESLENMEVINERKAN